MALVPVLLGVGTAYLLRQVYMLAIAVFSLVMLLGSYVDPRDGGRSADPPRCAVARPVTCCQGVDRSGSVGTSASSAAVQLSQ